jgi:GntR family transcriptional regulator
MRTQYIGNGMPPRNAQIRIDLDSSEPAYRQISSQLRTLFVEGALVPGDALPPVRKLAMDLAVHFNTVAEAYRLLAEEGWLDVGHGRNARVVERRAPKTSEAGVETHRRKLRQLLAEMRASGVSASRVRKELETLIEAMES